VVFEKGRCLKQTILPVYISMFFSRRRHVQGPLQLLPYRILHCIHRDFDGACPNYLTVPKELLHVLNNISTEKIEFPKFPNNTL
jgi:hypothetical protein